ncbi:MAG: RND family transporter [Candidatus Thalassarchaeum sp.]
MGEEEPGDRYSIAADEERDDERAFWDRFFESLKPLKQSLDNAKESLSSSFIGDGVDTIAQLVDDASDAADAATRRTAELAYSSILRSPAAIVVLLILVTATIGRDAMEFEHQINGDVEIYLPDGADSTELLQQVREQWSTDIFMLYIQTDNAIADPSMRGTENITDVEILKQISWIEGDDQNRGIGGYQSGLDYNKEDRGAIDGVVWVLSPAQIVKEANSSSYRFNCAMEKYALPTGDGEDCAISSLNPFEGYSIPEGDGAQERIDRFVEDAEPLLSSFVRDTNDLDLNVDSDEDGDPTNDLDGDGIWDTAVVIIGLKFDMSDTAITPRDDPKGKSEENPSGQLRDHKAFIRHAELLIYEESDPTICPICHRTYLSPTSTMDEFTSTDERKAVTITGLTPVVHDISDAIYQELVDRMLPISGVLVCLAMLLLHRNPKVIIICGAPILMSLAITFGITVIADITLTPMIISVGPILVGLGVDYALHLTNRIEENRVELIEERLEMAWSAQRDGFETEDIDPWDSHITLTATVRAVLTTGHAIFLSALTTIIGFSVLRWPSLVPIEPMRTVGTTLLLGIAITFVMSMILVPALVQLLKYRKTPFKAFDRLWEKIGEVPVKNTAIVLLVTLVLTAAGASILKEELGQGISGAADEVPPGLPSYETLREYSIVFEGGQTNMFIVDATQRGSQNGTAPIRDLPILDAIEVMQADKIDQVANTTTISLVTILKSIHVDVVITARNDTIGLNQTLEIYDESLWDILHDECWDESSNLLRPDCWPYAATNRQDMVNVAFDTLSPEIRSMLMNSDQGTGETKTLVYVNQPYLNLGDATILRDAIDGFLSGGKGCDSAWTCAGLEIEQVFNSLLTGGLPVSIDVNDGVHEAQSETTIATMLILLIAMAFLFRSPRLALFTMIAVGVVVVWQPLLMRSGGVNVNFFTAMVGTIVFGIGVDDSIHIVDRIKDERETPSGIVKSVAKTGQTIFETTTTTCAGLAAGLFVAIPGLQNFFILMMLLLILALLTSSILLPAMIVAYYEVGTRITKGESWLDYEHSGALATESVLDAIVE